MPLIRSYDVKAGEAATNKSFNSTGSDKIGLRSEKTAVKRVRFYQQINFEDFLRSPHVGWVSCDDQVGFIVVQSYKLERWEPSAADKIEETAQKLLRRQQGLPLNAITSFRNSENQSNSELQKAKQNIKRCVANQFFIHFFICYFLFFIDRLQTVITQKLIKCDYWTSQADLTIANRKTSKNFFSTISRRNLRLKSMANQMKSEHAAEILQ